MAGSVGAVVRAWTPLRPVRTGSGLPLLCFPYAGGGAGVFRAWFDELPGSIEAVPLEFPGRGARHAEPLLRTVADLADAAFDGLAVFWSRPFALYGHSLGALVAYELARRLVTAGCPPLHLFVGGRRAPQLPEPRAPAHQLPSPEFRARLREWGGTPQEVLDHPEMMALIEPIVRADLEAAETYALRPAEDVRCPLTAFAGLADTIVPPEAVAAWSACTSGYFAFRPIPGSHFFVHGNRALLLGLIAREIELSSIHAASF